MTYNSEQTRKRIINAAKQEFQKEGFYNANLRRIADKAKISTGSIYSHFESKEELFAALVDDIYNAFVKEEDDIMESNFMINLEDQEKKIEAALSFVAVMMQNREGFELLLCHSAGTRYENFIDDAARSYAKKSMQLLNIAKEKGYIVNVPQETHVNKLCKSYLTLIMDIIKDNMPDDQIKDYVADIITFEHFGWQGLLGRV